MGGSSFNPVKVVKRAVKSATTAVSALASGDVKGAAVSALGTGAATGGGLIGASAGQTAEDLVKKQFAQSEQKVAESPDLISGVATEDFRDFIFKGSSVANLGQTDISQLAPAAREFERGTKNVSGIADVEAVLNVLTKRQAALRRTKRQPGRKGTVLAGGKSELA